MASEGRGLPGSRSDRSELPVLAGLVAIVLGFSILHVARFGAGPLWFDEAWTGAIAITRGAGDFAKQLWLDTNPPLFFLVERGVCGVFGASDVALRAPSLLFTLLTPLAALWPVRSLSLRSRLIWAALLAAWSQELVFANEARAYALAILLATANVALLVRLVEDPSARRAVAWGGCGCLLLITQYHAYVLVALEGALLCIAFRRRPLLVGLAALPLAPAMAWLVYHYPRLSQFARPDVAWYPKMSTGFLRDSAFLFAGSYLGLAALVLILVAGAALWLAERGRGRAGVAASVEAGRRFLPLAIPIAASVGGFAALILLHAFRPILAVRYLVVFGPGVLLLLALAPALYPKWRWLPLLGLLVVLGYPTVQLARSGRDLEAKSDTLEGASNWLEARAARKVTVLLESPTDRVMTDFESATLFRFFFDRDRYPVRIERLRYAPGEASTPRLVAALKTSGDAVLWRSNRRFMDARVAEGGHDLLRAAQGVAGEVACRIFLDGPKTITACVVEGPH